MLAYQQVHLANELERQSQAVERETSGSGLRSIAQLQRESLRLMLLLDPERPGSTEEITLQRQLITSRVRILERHDFARWVAGTPLEAELDTIGGLWKDAEDALDRLADVPGDVDAREEALAALIRLEGRGNRLIRQASVLSQLQVGDRGEAAMAALRDAERALLGWLVFVALVGVTGLRLLSDRRRALAALGRRERQLRGIFEGTPDGLVLVDEQGRVAEWSPGHERLTGMAREDVIGRAAPEVRSLLSGSPEEGGRSPAYFAARLKEVLETGRADWLDEPFEYRLVPAQGAPRTVQAVAFAIPTAHGHMMGILHRDVTEMRRAEHAMRHSQRLESLGLLAGGVAHDFNNLLTGVLGRATLARKHVGEQDRAREHLDAIEHAARRGAELTRQLLVYAGRAPARKEVLDLNHLVRDGMALLETAVSSRAHLRLELGARVSPVEVDAAQVRQIVMNLVLNGADAVDATGREGAVSLRTCMIEIEDVECHTGFVGATPLGPGCYVCLSVDDEGVGMDAATLERLYEPFFSTKQEGRGLGLSTTLGIVRAHGGWLRAQARPGGGTSFTVLLRPFETNATLRPPESRDRSRDHGSREPRLLPARVLVVDDEVHVRQVTRAMLDEFGIETVGAASGEEALEIYGAQGETIDLVLLDVRMPGMDGGQTAEALRVLDPRVRVMLFTGHGREDIHPLASRLGLGEPLRKPFDLEQLLDRLEALMGEASTRSI